jgi:hypothetical protein
MDPKQHAGWKVPGISPARAPVQLVLRLDGAGHGCDDELSPTLAVEGLQSLMIELRHLLSLSLDGQQLQRRSAHANELCNTFGSPFYPNGSRVRTGHESPVAAALARSRSRAEVLKSEA